MKVTIEKKTDQLNYEDFLGGVTRVVTVAGVKAGTKEQQYDIAIEGDKRVWRPAVTVLKLLVAAWGNDATEWVGRRAELYGDPDIMFGREKVGGIRVSRVSHIDGPVTANLTETRGKRKKHTVDPLPDSAPALQFDGITGPMLSKLQILLKECGVTDRDTALAYYARVTGREVDSSKALTRNEAGQVLSDLERVRAGEPNLLDPASANDPSLDNA